MDAKEALTSALRKLGPASPAAIAKQAGLEASVAGYHLRAMHEAKELKATGKGRGRIYALNDQDLAGTTAAAPTKRTPPAKRKASKKKKGNGGRVPRAPREEPAEFIPAIDVENGLVLIGAGPKPIRFNQEQTGQIADLLFAHYEE